MWALSAEKQHERQGKKEKEVREWARCADQLEAALLQGFPATMLTDSEESGFPKVLLGTSRPLGNLAYSKGLRKFCMYSA